MSVLSGPVVPFVPDGEPVVSLRREWAGVPHEQVVVIDGDGHRTPFTGAWPRRNAWAHLRVGDAPWVVGLDEGGEGVTGAWAGPGEGEVLLIVQGAAVVLGLGPVGGDGPREPVSVAAVPMDVTGVHPDPPTRSLLLLSGTAATVWRDGAVAWTRQDLGVDGAHLVLVADGVAIVRVQTGFPDSWHEVALAMADGAVVAGPWRCTERV